MRTFRTVFTLALLLASPRAGNARAQREPYVLEVSGETVRLCNTRTRRVLWTKKFAYHSSPFWSRDHRAFALAGVEKEDKENNGETIFVWRQGERVRRFSPITISTRLRLFNDTVPLNHFIGGAWSPDKRRVLLLLGEGTNGLQFNEGYLCGCTFGRDGRARFSAPSVQNYLSLGHFRWRDSRTSLYFPLIYTKSGGSLVAKTPRFWSVP